jgi:hypothetical protein
LGQSYDFGLQVGICNEWARAPFGGRQHYLRDWL